MMLRSPWRGKVLWKHNAFVVAELGLEHAIALHPGIARYNSAAQHNSE